MSVRKDGKEENETLAPFLLKHFFHFDTQTVKTCEGVKAKLSSDGKYELPTSAHKSWFHQLQVFPTLASHASSNSNLTISRFFCDG